MSPFDKGGVKGDFRSSQFIVVAWFLMSTSGESKPKPDHDKGFSELLNGLNRCE
jgi:hypothetical protein